MASAIFIILFIASIGFLVARYLNSLERRRRGPTDTASRSSLDLSPFRRYLPLLVIFLFLIFVLLPSMVVIEPGKRGVIFNMWYGVSGETLGEGVHFILPFVEKVTRYDVRIQNYSISKGKGTKEIAERGTGKKEEEDSWIWATTADGLKVGVDISVFYRLDPEKLPDIHKKVGSNYEEKIINPEILNVVRMVTSRYKVFDIYSKERANIQERIFIELANRLAEKWLICDKTLIQEFSFPSDFMQALEKEAEAKQEIKRLEYVKQQREKEAEARLIEARGEVDAFKRINEIVKNNPELLQYMWINKLAEDVQLLVVPSSDNLLLNPGEFMRREEER